MLQIELSQVSAHESVPILIELLFLDVPQPILFILIIIPPIFLSFHPPPRLWHILCELQCLLSRRLLPCLLLSSLLSRRLRSVHHS